MLSFWEKALMPMLNCVVFTLFPAPLSIVRKDASLGLAHGACLMANRGAYTRMGGHSLVRDQIFEDTRLAQLWRERGESSVCLDGQNIARVRMYNSFGEIWSGFQKNFYPAFRHKTSFWLFLFFTSHFSSFLFWLCLSPCSIRLKVAARLCCIERDCYVTADGDSLPSSFVVTRVCRTFR